MNYGKDKSEFYILREFSVHMVSMDLTNHFIAPNNVNKLCD